MTDTSYNKFFKYINFYILFFVSFYIMYQPNLELIGLILCLMFYYIIYGLLNLDIITSPKNNDPVLILLVLILSSSFLSFAFLISMFVTLHNTYGKYGLPIQFTKESREDVNIFKYLLVSNIVLTGIMVFLYFTAYKYDKGTVFINDIEIIYAPFFDFSNKTASGYIFLFFKLIITISLLGSTGYIIYQSYKLSQLSSVKIVTPITEKNEDGSVTYKPPSFPFNNTFFTNNGISNMFQNLNLNYMTNYTPTL